MKNPKYKHNTIDGKQYLLHRHIIENSLGRKLSPSELVHHIDENILNNDISNLMIVSKAEHNHLHKYRILYNYNNPNKTLSIKINSDFHLKLKVAAIKKNIPIYKFIIQAIEEKLIRDGD